MYNSRYFTHYYFYETASLFYALRYHRCGDELLRFS